jgi:hypothetical protein
MTLDEIRLKLIQVKDWAWNKFKALIAERPDTFVGNVIWFLKLLIIGLGLGAIWSVVAALLQFVIIAAILLIVIGYLSGDQTGLWLVDWIKELFNNF